MSGAARKVAREVVWYKSIPFVRYPESRHASSRLYFTPGARHRSQGVESLHREIWKDAYGPIPPGYEVHHQDHNTLNNALDNLVCLTRAEHLAHHAQNLTAKQRAVIRLNWERAKVAAANWHGSTEGRIWHSDLGRLSWDQRVSREYTCLFCGAVFQSRKTHAAVYCSGVCRAAARRARGVDNELRSCGMCGGAFLVSRFSGQRFCSRVCGGRHSRLPREAVTAG